MSIIEQAAERLEQLKRAGIELPAVPQQARESLGEAKAETGPKPEKRAARPASAPAAGAASAIGDAQHQPRPERPARSREVVLDLDRLARDGFVTAGAKRSQIAEEFRVIKRPILQNVQGKTAGTIERANLVMVTSALPNEGKSFTALNLALSLATELDHTVLLVDADVAKPSVLRMLGLSVTKGLLDVLTDPRIHLGDVLLKTNVETLTLLPAGTAHRKATEVLASDAMADLVAEIASRYPDRIVVFDSPPLLPTTEARVLANHMGQIVVVVEADRTTQAAAKQALATLENCPVVMMVLNKATRSEVGSYYAGYYGHYGEPA